MNIDLRYPIGKFKKKIVVTELMINELISDIESLPALLLTAVYALTPEQLDTRYRPEGWTIRQVIHHLPDSHLQAYVRFKLALTEENPAIKTYKENLWAELKDTFEAPIEVSINLLDSLHKRWTVLLKSLSPEQFDKTFYHPEWENISLRTTLALYAWHGKHHLAHITSIKERMGW